MDNANSQNPQLINPQQRPPPAGPHSAQANAPVHNYLPNMQPNSQFRPNPQPFSQYNHQMSPQMRPSAPFPPQQQQFTQQRPNFPPQVRPPNSLPPSASSTPRMALGAPPQQLARPPANFTNQSVQGAAPLSRQTSLNRPPSISPSPAMSHSSLPPPASNGFGQGTPLMYPGAPSSSQFQIAGQTIAGPPDGPGVSVGVSAGGHPPVFPQSQPGHMTANQIQPQSMTAPGHAGGIQGQVFPPQQPLISQVDPLTAQMGNLVVSAHKTGVQQRTTTSTARSSTNSSSAAIPIGTTIPAATNQHTTIQPTTAIRPASIPRTYIP
ncbi:hypothetical protein HK096_008995 [Nowakowskiella sp. JEL0078]|nr:hypothetical protein HK096_008995 [Nowakowskiella sp. JEL0078]